MTEDEMSEAAGLVARFYSRDKNGNRKGFDELFAIQRRLLVLGVQLTTPLPAPDTTAPPGGSTQALKVA